MPTSVKPKLVTTMPTPNATSPSPAPLLVLLTSPLQASLSTMRTVPRARRTRQLVPARNSSATSSATTLWPARESSRMLREKAARLSARPRTSLVALLIVSLVLLVLLLLTLLVTRTLRVGSSFLFFDDGVVRC